MRPFVAPMLLQAPERPRSSRPVSVERATAARFALRVLFGAKRFTVPAAILLSLHMIGEALVPLIVGFAIDRAIATGDIGQLLWWLAVLALDFLVLSFTFRFGARIGLYGMQLVQHRLRTQVTDRLLQPRGTAHGTADSAAREKANEHADASRAADTADSADTAETAVRNREAGAAPTVQSNGAALSIATSDVARLAAVMQLGVYPVGEVASLIFASIALWLLSPALGIAAAVGAASLLVGVFLLGGPLQRRSHEQQAAVADAAGQAADLLSGYRVIKGLRAEHEAGLRYRRVSQTALAGTLRAKSAHGRHEGTLQLLTGAFVAGIAVLAAVLALRGQLGVGELIAAAGLVQFVAGPLSALPSQTGYVWATALASSARVLRILAPEAESGESGARGAAKPVNHLADGGEDAQDASTRQASSRQVDTQQTGIRGIDKRVKRIDGKYDTGHQGRFRLSLPGTELELLPGECIGVVTDQQGAARLLRSISKEHESVLIAPHRSELFDGSIAWNLDTPGSRKEILGAALHAAACDDIIAALPSGLDSTVGDAGALLSGGQRQRLALARAYARDAPILVLHEPTTAIDAATEHLIAERLGGVRGSGSTLLITSSPALLAVCDRVVHFDPSVREGHTDFSDHTISLEPDTHSSRPEPPTPGATTEQSDSSSRNSAPDRAARTDHQ